MRIALAIALTVLTGTAASAQYNSYGSRGNSYGSYGSFGSGSNPSSTYVRPSINSQGSYTGGHYRTTPNNTQFDNYGARGNLNPYTGRNGTRSPRY